MKEETSQSCECSNIKHSIIFKMNFPKYVFYLVLMMAFFSCSKGRKMKTTNGFDYILYTESKGAKAKLGDYITLSMVYKNSEDSVLFDSRVQHSPIRFRLEKIPFKGSFEDGITNLSINDSATFFVPSDSMYNYMIKSRNENMPPQDHTGFLPKTFLRFDIKLLNIQNDVQAEEEMMMELSKKEKSDKKALEEYIRRKNITVNQDPSGYYLIMIENGKGEKLDSGKIVTIDYEGRFLNDSVFDGTKIAGHPYKFVSGANHVIPAWEMAMKKMRVGDKFIIVVPARLGYGEEGIQNPNTGKYIVPPFTSLVFDIQILGVEDMPAVSNR
jgi:FKBP-type peptidyl-prolyl cis-trans isomerase FkpA